MSCFQQQPGEIESPSVGTLRPARHTTNQARRPTVVLAHGPVGMIALALN